MKKKTIIGICTAFILAVIAAIVIIFCLKKYKSEESSSRINIKTEGDFEYYVEDDDEGEGVIVYKYKGTDADVVIPDKIEGVSVIEISSFSFSDNLSIVSVYIPDSVTQIYDEAFSGCYSLKKVTGGKNVEKIYCRAFFDCWSLENITLSDNLVEIEKCAFEYCFSLKSINLPQSLKKIGSFAFDSCEQLDNIVIPDGVEAIDGGCFNGTKWYNALNGNVVVANGILIRHELCDDYNNIDNWIPYGVKIMSTDYDNNDNTENLYIPNSVEKIDRFYFSYMKNTNVYIPTTVSYIGSLDSDDDSKDNHDEVGDGVTFMVEKDSYAMQYAIDHDIPYEIVDDVQAVYESTYIVAIGCDSGTNVISENGYEYVVDRSGEIVIIRYTGDDDEVNFPQAINGTNVYKIGDGIHNVLENLSVKSISIPDTVTEIGDKAFCKNSTLAQVSGMESVKHIGDRAFWGTAWLEASKGNIVVGDGILIRRELYADNQSESIWIPQGTKTMLTDNNKDIMVENIYIPDSVETIDRDYFSDIIYANLYIPSSVTNMENQASPDSEEYFGEGIRFMVEDGSYAMNFAIDNDIEYVVVDNVQAIYESTLAQNQ